MADPLHKSEHITQISHILTEGESFLVTAHANPDGDAVGSTVALGHMLQRLGKQVVLYNATPLPEAFSWLELPCPLLTSLPEELPQWVVVLDCGSADRVSEEFTQKVPAQRIVNIDHHKGNPEFGTVNWVDPEQPAVGAMLAELCLEIGLTMDGPLAEAIYLAMSTDTGFFTYGNTTPECLELAAQLMRNGLDVAEVVHNIRDRWSENRMRLWAEIMGDVRLHLDGNLAVVSISRETFERTGTTREDAEGVINFVRRLEGVRVATLIREEDSGTCKISMRSHGEDDVRQVAVAFGGGGHTNAAGATLNMSLQEAEAAVVDSVKKRLTF